MLELLRDVIVTLARYVRGQAVKALWMTLYHVLAFWLIGLPWWWLAGFVVGALTALPMVGFIVGSIIPIAIVIGAGGGLNQALLALAVMIVGQAVETFYVGPKILGRELDISPLLVFAAVVVGTIFFGPPGTIFGAPVAAVAVMIYRKRKNRLAATSPAGISPPVPAETTAGSDGNTRPKTSPNSRA